MKLSLGSLVDFQSMIPDWTQNSRVTDEEKAWEEEHLADWRLALASGRRDESKVILIKRKESLWLP